MSRGGETEVRVYEGEVEHFVVGPERGHRHPRHPRRPHRLRLRRHARRRRRSPRCWPRRATTCSSAPSTSGPAWPSPTASRRHRPAAVERRAGGVPDRAQDRPRQGARAARRSAPTRACASTTPTTPTPTARSAVATTTGIRSAGRENGCYVSVSTLADDGDETPDAGSGSASAARPTSSTSTRAAREAAERATRLLGATKPPIASALTVVLDPFVTAQFLGIISSTLNGEAVVKGRSLFRDRLGEQVAAAARDARRRPDQPDRLHGHRRRRRGPRGPPQRADRRTACCSSSCTTRTRRAGPARCRPATPSAAASPGTPGVGCLALQLAPGTRSQAELIADIDDGLLVQSVQGLHSGVNPISGDFSTGAAGLLITQRRRSARRCASSRSPRRCSGCCSTSSRSAATSTGCRCAPPASASSSATSRCREPEARRCPCASRVRRRSTGIRTSPRRSPPGGSASTCTATRCGAATRRRRPTSSRGRRVESGIDVLCITDHNAIAGAVELRRPAAVPGGRRRGAAHRGRRDHRAVPHRAHADRARPRRGGARRSATRAASSTSRTRSTRCAATSTEPALVRARRARPDRRHRGAQRQDVAGEPQPAGGRVRRRVRARRAAPAATPTCPTRSARPTSRCPTSTAPRSSSPRSRGGVVVGHHWDEARPWTPRIVPSVELRPRRTRCAPSCAIAEFTRRRGRHCHGTEEDAGQAVVGGGGDHRRVALGHGELDRRRR